MEAFQPSSVRIRLPWCNAIEVDRIALWQTAYSTDNFREQRCRRDSVQYDINGQKRVGIISLILKLRGTGQSEKVVISRRLRLWDPHPDNTKIMKEFGHKQAELCIWDGTQGDLLLDFFPARYFRRIIPYILDYHDIALRYSIAQSFDDSDLSRITSWFKEYKSPHSKPPSSNNWYI